MHIGWNSSVGSVAGLAVLRDAASRVRSSPEESPLFSHTQKVDLECILGWRGCVGFESS